jgi:pimeloyl-ACP methyl ester carboxylesterase
MTSPMRWIETGAFFTNKAGHRLFYRVSGPEGAPVLVMLHGFPTWSIDWFRIVPELSEQFRVICFDFLGFGASAKPAAHSYSIFEQADLTQELLAHLKVTSCGFVAHDYGTTVGQELLARRERRRLPIDLTGAVFLNGGMVYSAYRPTLGQKLLLLPGLGRLFASQLSYGRMFRALAKLWGKKSPLDDAEFKRLWWGIERHHGLARLPELIRYIPERRANHPAWEAAVASTDVPLAFAWGMLDPVSGAHVFDALKPLVPDALFTQLPLIGHYPQVESPAEVIQTIELLFSGARA